MSDGPDARDALLGRIERLESRVRLLGAGLAIVAAAAIGVWIAQGVTSSSKARFDTVTAHRFVLEHEGKVRGELSMFRGMFAQLLLGPDDRSRPGVAIAERGELVLRGHRGRGLHVLGTSMQFGGLGGGPMLGLEHMDNLPYLFFVDSTGIASWFLVDSTGNVATSPRSRPLVDLPRATPDSRPPGGR